MGREKIKIKKIDNLTARRVAFSKRKRGLIKKAQELSILCDADVSLIIFSATGKLHEFSSSSMEDTLTRYVLHSNSVEKSVQPCLALQKENSHLELLHKEVNDMAGKLRQMRGEDLEGLDVDELGQLENKLEAGLSLVIETEEERASTEINKLQRKEAQLIKENKQLKQKKPKACCWSRLTTFPSAAIALLLWMMIALIPQVRASFLKLKYQTANWRIFCKQTMKDGSPYFN